MRQLAVARERADTKVDVPVNLVGMASVDETLHHRDDRADLFRRAGVMRRRQDVEGRICACHSSMKRSVSASGSIPSALARLMILSSISVKFWMCRTS